MDRTTWIAIAVCIAGLIWWNINASQRQAERMREYRKAVAEYEARQALAVGDDAGVGERPSPPPGVAPERPARESAIGPAETVEEKTMEAASGELNIVFTNRGGGAREIRLTNHEAEYGERVVFNRHGVLATGAVFEGAGLSGTEPYEIALRQDHAGVVEALVAERELSPGVRLVKTFELPPSPPTEDPFAIELHLEWKNGSEAALVWGDYAVAAGGIGPIHAADWVHYTGFDFFREGNTQYNAVTWFEEQKIPLIGVQTREARTVFRETPGNVEWFGVRNQFFAAMLTPREATGTGVWARRLDILRPEESRPLRGVEGAIVMPGFSVAPGGEHRQTFQVFVGPRELSRLKKFANNEDQIIEYRIMGFSGFRFVSEILLHSLNGLKSILGNYAWAIIALTVIIKLALFPLQSKATTEMKRMSLLSPKIAEMREKYKDEPQKMNEEMMKMYREYGVNPFAGCLPMLVQIPIFFGFYSVLGTAVELRNTGFLWIRDLSQPDTLFHIGSFPVNVLPLLMAGTMFWQMALTPKTGDKMQQRIFMIMPVMFVVFCYGFASALALYWTVQNLFSIVQLYLTRNKPLPELKKVQRAKNAREAFAQARGGGRSKGPRGPRTTKSNRK